MTYQGKVSKTYSYLVPQNQEEYEDPGYMFDNTTEKTGFSNACDFINTQMTQFFKGKELPLTKKVFD